MALTAVFGERPESRQQSGESDLTQTEGVLLNAAQPVGKYDGYSVCGENDWLV